MQALLMNKGILAAGDYVIKVDAAWNAESSNDH